MAQLLTNLILSLCLPAALAVGQEPVQAFSAPVVAASTQAAPRALTVLEMVDRSNKVLRGDSSRARVTMTIVTPDWTRSLDIEAWNQGRVKALILIHAPPKEKGTATLRRGTEMWTWMPRVERLMKVPPTMMHSSWQGSDFTYEDIVKADSVVKDYTHKILRRERGSEYETAHIEALPKPDAPVVWGKVMLKLAVYPDDWVIPLEEEDYSERGELMRVISLSRIQLMDGRLVPTRLECRPQRRPGRRTVLDYHSLQFDLKLEDSFFSLSRLQK